MISIMISSRGIIIKNQDFLQLEHSVNIEHHFEVNYFFTFSYFSFLIMKYTRLNCNYLAKYINMLITL